MSGEVKYEDRLLSIFEELITKMKDEGGSKSTTESTSSTPSKSSKTTDFLMKGIKGKDADYDWSEVMKKRGDWMSKIALKGFGSLDSISFSGMLKALSNFKDLFRLSYNNPIEFLENEWFILNPHYTIKNYGPNIPWHSNQRWFLGKRIPMHNVISYGIMSGIAYYKTDWMMFIILSILYPKPINIVDMSFIQVSSEHPIP